MQIDFTPPVLNRQYRVRTTSASFIPTAATQLVMVIRATQDGSVPNNTSPILRQGVLQMPTASANFMSPLIEYVFPVTAAGTWRFLLTANVQSGTGQWQSPTGAAAGPLEMRVEDLGPLTTGNNTATGRLIGSGTAGLA
jgi:hypothetical protein